MTQIGRFTKGLMHIRDAYHIAFKHCPLSLAHSQWNYAAKQAFDAMEFAAKGVMLLGNEEPPSGRGGHNVRLTQDTLSQVPLIAWRLEDDPLQGCGVCIIRKSGVTPCFNLLEFTRGTFTLRASWHESAMSAPELMIDDLAIHVFDQSLPCVTIPSGRTELQLKGHWMKAVINDVNLRMLGHHLRRVQRGRVEAAYYEKVYTYSEAEIVCRDAQNLFSRVKRHLGHPNESASLHNNT